MEHKQASSLVVVSLGKTNKEILSIFTCQAVAGPGSLLVVVAQPDKRLANRACNHMLEEEKE